MGKKKLEINLTNVKAFVEGYTKMGYDKIIGLPIHIQEQIQYRESKCPDCLEAGECKVCGCSVPGKWFVTKSCNNGERFPDLMNKEEWEEFKAKQND